MTPTDWADLTSWNRREAHLLGPWAMHSADSAGRVHPEPVHPFRSPYQRDRDRIVHSAAFRRLAHKTQVFTGNQGDYHRSRLTHTLEVTSIARTLARALALNEDLVETLALGHDIAPAPILAHVEPDQLVMRCLPVGDEPQAMTDGIDEFPVVGDGIDQRDDRPDARPPRLQIDQAHSAARTGVLLARDHAPTPVG
jgi:hypothetical protein